MARNALITKITTIKKYYIQRKIENSDGKHKSIFPCIDELLYKPKDNVPPSSIPTDQLLGTFVNFLGNNIFLIHSAFETFNTVTYPSIRLPDHRMTYFNKVSVDDIKKLSKESNTKSCLLDPFPTFLLKECIDYLTLIITTIINSSISHCQVPSTFKSVVGAPLWKKFSLPQI